MQKMLQWYADQQKTPTKENLIIIQKKTSHLTWKHLVVVVVVVVCCCVVLVLILLLCINFLNYKTSSSSCNGKLCELHMAKFKPHNINSSNRNNVSHDVPKWNGTRKYYWICKHVSKLPRGTYYMIIQNT